MKPALTPEEWVAPKVMFRPSKNKWEEGYGIELLRNPRVEDEWAMVFDGSWAVCLTGGARHKLAALALHGQPFGFTREDVLDTIAAAGHLNSSFPEFCVRLRNLATRIESLLPPEPK